MTNYQLYEREKRLEQAKCLTTSACEQALRKLARKYGI